VTSLNDEMRNGKATVLYATAAFALPGRIRMAQLGTVGRPRQQVVIGEPGELGPRFFRSIASAIEGGRRRRRGVDAAARRAAFPEVERKGSDHTAGLGLLASTSRPSGTAASGWPEQDAKRCVGRRYVGRTDCRDRPAR